jgi:DNA-binding response OmpR family regulator
VHADTARPQVLLVDDDAALGTVMDLRLRDEGFDLHEARDGSSALERARAVAFDLLILDGILPGIDGLVLCRALRAGGANRRTPILMISARDSESDRILGLESGADDYLPKPFGFDELIARMRALVRRSGPTRVDPWTRAAYEVAGVTVDPGRRAVTVHGHPVDLTPQEFELLALLTSRPGRVFSREAILQQLWPHDVAVSTRTIDAVVSRLRKKIETDTRAPRLILRAWGVGYRFTDER